MKSIYVPGQNIAPTIFLATVNHVFAFLSRFSHLASSPSRSVDTIDSVDIMNLSTEFQQELLDLIQSEDADEEDILSQLTGK